MVPTRIWSLVTPCCWARAGIAARAKDRTTGWWIFLEWLLAKALRIHRLDLGRVLLLHQLAFELHGGRQLLVFGRELRLQQEELLDLLDPGEPAVHAVDLALDQRLHRRRAGQAGVVGEGHVVVLRVLLHVLQV